ncbi:hypothetical protein NDU88_005275 [Pleurodeles waltl]|uniref:Uncharacterized protein n=1 Tax=Pleurodeles waltl TaxID=8319 RepID=A0AAV7UKI6_PLEWA|nr:hypothetical protein NDU88_005275 [Pleurodeles waltl]
MCCADCLVAFPKPPPRTGGPGGGKGRGTHGGVSLGPHRCGLQLSAERMARFFVSFPCCALPVPCGIATGMQHLLFVGMSRGVRWSRGTPVPLHCPGRQGRRKDILGPFRVRRRCGVPLSIPPLEGGPPAREKAQRIVVRHWPIRFVVPPPRDSPLTFAQGRTLLQPGPGTHHTAFSSLLLRLHSTPGYSGHRGRPVSDRGQPPCHRLGISARPRPRSTILDAGGLHVSVCAFFPAGWGPYLFVLSCPGRE